MKLTRKVATRALVLAATGGAVLGLAGTAFAATPPYEPDPTDQIGQVLFYDASGNSVTGGSVSDTSLAKFAVATADDPVTANNHASLFIYTPVNGVNPGLWSGEQVSASTVFPVASPANVAAAGLHRPVVTGNTTDTTLANYIIDFPNTDTTSAYAGLYQVRILTNGNSKYWAADIQVTGSGPTATWQLVYPTIASSTTALAATPPSPQTVPASAITLTATVTANAAGTVVFTNTDTSTQVGTTQTLPASATNTASVTIPAGLAQGTHHYSATYTPAVGTPFTGSSGPLTYQVNAAPADVTTTSLAVTPTPVTVGDTFTMNSHVADTTVPATVPVGSVSWFDGATQIAGPTAVDASGNASAGPGAFGLTATSHSITAVFTPTNPATFNSSTSAAVTFSLAPAAGDPCSNTGSPKPFPNDTRANTCVSTGTIDTTVPSGNLYISTPYTASNPFHLGAMSLSADGTNLHTASVPFGSATLPTGTNPYPGVTIIDTNPGTGWTAQVSSTDFTRTGGAGSISACNLGFTGVTPLYIPGNAINGTAPHAVTTTNLPNGGTAAIAAAGSTSCTTGLTANGLGSAAGHTFATIASPNGTGSVYVYGNMDLYAPTSTPAGLYSATVTFTIF